MLDKPAVQLGVDRLVAADMEPLRGMRVGLVTHPAGVDGRLVPTWQRLHKSSNVTLGALFGPEHGFSGHVQDALKVDSSRHKHTGLPIYSLYESTGHFGGTEPSVGALKQIDVLVIDLQDVGVRFYTYISTVVHVLRAAAKVGVPVWVLDRPNPLTGSRVEGNVLEEGFQSFLGVAPIPWRHGLTIGEATKLLRRLLGIPCDVHVITMSGWRRTMWFEETGLSWVPPSPNIPTYDTVVVYPGTCLFEGTNVSEGRGTTRPFELIGAPWIDGVAWAERLNEEGLAGCRFRPASFIPVFDKYVGERCEGVQIHVTDRTSFKPILAGITMLCTLRDLFADEFQWRSDPSVPKPFIDWLAGSHRLRRLVDDGRPAVEIVERLEEGLHGFRDMAEPFLLY